MDLVCCQLYFVTTPPLASLVIHSPPSYSLLLHASLPSLLTLQIREASQALLQAELRRIQSEGRKKLVMEWAGRLQAPAPHRGSGERGTRISMEEGDLSVGEHGSELTFNPLLVLNVFA